MSDFETEPIAKQSSQIYISDLSAAQRAQIRKQRESAATKAREHVFNPSFDAAAMEKMIRAAEEYKRANPNKHDLSDRPPTTYHLGEVVVMEQAVTVVESQQLENAA